MRRILNGGIDVLAFKEIVIGKDLVEVRAVGEEFQNVRDPQALTTNAGAASAFAFFNGDSFESIGAHMGI